MKKITICVHKLMKILWASLSNRASILICSNCVRKNNCQLCRCRQPNNITTDLDDLEWYFHVFQCLDLNGAPAHFLKLASLGRFLQFLDIFVFNAHIKIFQS